MATIYRIGSKYAHTSRTAAHHNHWRYFSVTVSADILHTIHVCLKKTKVHYVFVHVQLPPASLWILSCPWQGKRDHATGRLRGASSACGCSQTLLGCRTLLKKLKGRAQDQYWEVKVLFPALVQPEPGHATPCVLAFLLCNALGYILTKKYYVGLSCYIKITIGKHDTKLFHVGFLSFLMTIENPG